MEEFFLSNSDLKSLSFVTVIRDHIEDRAKLNLRALIEDDPRKWHLLLAEALADVSSSIRKGVEMPANPLLPPQE